MKLPIWPILLTASCATAPGGPLGLCSNQVLTPEGPALQSQTRNKTYKQCKEQIAVSCEAAVEAFGVAVCISGFKENGLDSERPSDKQRADRKKQEDELKGAAEEEREGYYEDI